MPDKANNGSHLYGKGRNESHAATDQRPRDQVCHRHAGAYEELRGGLIQKRMAADLEDDFRDSKHDHKKTEMENTETVHTRKI